MSDTAFTLGEPWAHVALGVVGLALLALLSARSPPQAAVQGALKSLAAAATDASCRYYVLVNYSKWLEKPAPGAGWRPAVVLPAGENFWKLCYTPADSSGYPQYGPDSAFWWCCASREYGVSFVAGESGRKYLLVLRKGCGGWGWVLKSP